MDQKQNTQEMKVLGSFMIYSQLVDDLSKCFNGKNMFTRFEHSVIYDAILHLHQRKEFIDVCSVIKELSESNRLDEIGGASFILSLTEIVESQEDASTCVKSFFNKKTT